MSICDRCDKPARHMHSAILFEENASAWVWKVMLCRECARDVPKDLSLILGKEPDT